MKHKELSVDSDRLYLPRLRFSKEDNAPSSWGFTGKTMGFGLLLLLLVSLIGSFYLNQASHTAAAGLEITELMEERERLRQDNAELRKRIADKESLGTVRSRAQELGFIERQDVEYLIVDNLPAEPSDERLPLSVVAENRKPREPNSDAPALAYWWDELIAQLESWMSTQP